VYRWTEWNSIYYQEQDNHHVDQHQTVTFYISDAQFLLQRERMKKNIFYIIVGCIAIALVALFWYSDLLMMPPFMIAVTFVVAVLAIYLIRRKVIDLKEDERDVKITEQAVLRTMQVFWVVFFAFSIGAVMHLLRSPSFPPGIPMGPPPGPSELLSPRMIGFVQLGLLCLMIFLYVGFRIYYAGIYGDWETDEE